MKYQAKNTRWGYFTGWKATPYTTISRIALWSPNKEDCKVVNDQDLMELVVGYGNIRSRIVSEETTNKKGK